MPDAPPADPSAPATPRLADAVALLRELGGPHGLHASAAHTANYRAVFTRDAVMAGVAGLLLGDAHVTAAFGRTLEGLRARQGDEGQVPSNYEPAADGGPGRTSFGAVVPRVDAATWYLVGVALAARASALDPAPWRASVAATVRLLAAMEYNGRHLVWVPPGGNWADEYPFEGYVLYDQVLRAWALRLLAGVYAEPAWAAKGDAIAGAIAERYWPDDAAEGGDGAATPRGHPLAALSPTRPWDVFDLAACALLGVSGVAPAMAARTLDWIDRRFLAAGTLPPAFHPVIRPGDPEWPALRRYHLFAFRNAPDEYHNGGVWPIWLGWLALALAATGRTAALGRLRTLVARRLAEHPGWAFEEYFHGATGAPGGTPRMAYSATGLVLLDAAGGPAYRRLLGVVDVAPAV